MGNATEMTVISSSEAAPDNPQMSTTDEYGIQVLHDPSQPIVEYVSFRLPKIIGYPSEEKKNLSFLLTSEKGLRTLLKLFRW